jgi:aminoglycoside/choline kinase family phosphotransferase
MTDLRDPDPRAEARADFLRLTGRAALPLHALPVDASFRRYFRLVGSQPAMLLMDAPPPREDVRPFIRIARHLAALGLSPPRVYEVDEERGFALIEDFGEGTYTRLLDSGAAAEPLFAAAADALAQLHLHPEAAEIAAPAFDASKMMDEITELPDWYGLALVGYPLPPAEQGRFLDAWRFVLDSLPPAEKTLVLLDFHVDNLMWLPDRAGAAACGLLDFQDARIGPPAYDLLCLLRNERRGIDPSLSDRLFERYLRTVRPADPAAFALWYRVMAAQRYTKVLGRFARLTLRDARDSYLRYMPRFTVLLSEALQNEPLLHPVRNALDAMLAGWRVPPPDDPDGLRRRVALPRTQP